MGNFMRKKPLSGVYGMEKTVEASDVYMLVSAAALNGFTCGGGAKGSLQAERAALIACEGGAAVFKTPLTPAKLKKSRGYVTL